jgi:hypothetical protein
MTDNKLPDALLKKFVSKGLWAAAVEACDEAIDKRKADVVKLVELKMSLNDEVEGKMNAQEILNKARRALEEEMPPTHTMADVYTQFPEKPRVLGLALAVATRKQGIHHQFYPGGNKYRKCHCCGHKHNITAEWIFSNLELFEKCISEVKAEEA